VDAVQDSVDIPTMGGGRIDDQSRVLAANDFAPVRFSYRELPERNREAIWWELVGRKVFRAECQSLAEGPFEIDITCRASPGLGLVSVKSSGQSFIRTRELVDEGNGSFLLMITGAGTLVSAQRGREMEAREGDATLISYADRLKLVRPTAGASRSLILPYAALAPLVNNIEDTVVRPIPRHTEGLRLLTGYLDLLEQDDLLASAEARQLAVSHVHDLAALTIGATRDAAAFAEGHGLRAARLHAIKTDIIENVGNGSLTIDALARRHRFDPRYIQRLFEATGTTFTEFLVGQRLARARRMLLDLRYPNRSISSVAFACGFGDLSYFNRCFRRRFGTSPSLLRAETRRGDTI
jgi:AraC-like DNA-binding protein